MRIAAITLLCIYLSSITVYAEPLPTNEAGAIDYLPAKAVGR